jgi:hypothetical protein
MAEFEKNERSGTEQGYGVILTEPAAFSAGVAAGLIHLGDLDRGDLPVKQRSRDKEGLFGSSTSQSTS